jgi:hypothetical protein
LGTEEREEEGSKYKRPLEPGLSVSPSAARVEYETIDKTAKHKVFILFMA